MAHPSRKGKATWRTEHHQIIALLRTAREAAGLSQIDVAQKLGRDQSYVSKLARCAQGMEVVEFIDYCAAINVEPAEIFKELRNAY